MLWGSTPMAHGHGAPWGNATLQGNAPPQHMGLEHPRVPPPTRRTQPPSAEAPTCEAEAEGALGSAMAVAHLTGQQPPSPPAHTQQPQAVLVVVWHHHLTRALQFPQHLPTPASTAAVTSQLHRQDHCPIDRSHPTAQEHLLSHSQIPPCSPHKALTPHC